MNLNQHPIRHNEIWTAEEVAQLEHFMRETDASIREVAESMGRTPMAILLRVRKIVGIDVDTKETTGIAYKDNARWDEMEDKYLITQFNAGQSINQLAKYFDRTHKAVVARLYKVIADVSSINATYQRLRKLRKV